MSTPGDDPLRPLRHMPRAELEARAIGFIAPSGHASGLQRGEARYELILRDQEYDEQQEKSRRDFETALADKQLQASTNVRWATILATAAAVASAVSAIIQVVIAIRHG